MIYDLTIIGGGPAGIAAGVYASRKRLKTLFITKDFLGQSSVSEGIENWIGTVKISGTQLSKDLENHLKAYAGDIVDIKAGESCEVVHTNTDGTFDIQTNKGSYSSKTILVTTGSARRKLEIPGADRLEHKGLTYCATCDGPLFADQDVIVVGGGNAAFESAAQLLAYCKSVTLINRGSSFRADPVTVAKLSENPKLKIITNAISKEVLGEKFVSGFVYTNNTTGTDVTLSVTGIFVEIGSVPTTYFVKDTVKLDQWNHIMVDPRTQQTSQSGIWAAGDCTDGLYHQNNIAAGDAVKALEDIYVHLTTK
ncbi:MAG: FAD-dependent oxidoreductase [Candidatus Taylorbacteria bacterium]|nr:FAD-dependent oxidoreductase [Candidatus Taylorbacteria bacterium]